MSYSSLSASLEYLRYVPTAIRHISTLTVREKTSEAVKSEALGKESV